MYRGYEPMNTAYKVANSTGPRIPRSPRYQSAQAILAGNRMNPTRIYMNAQKRFEKKIEMLKRNEPQRQKHLKVVKTISNKKIAELSAQQKVIESKFEAAKKAVYNDIEKKTKILTSAKETFNKAIAERNNKIANIKREYDDKTARIKSDREYHERKYQQVFNPSNNHLYYGKSTTANKKRQKMAEFLVRKMYYDPQMNYHKKATQFISNTQMSVPPYNPIARAQNYIIGTRGMHNPLQTGKFTLPIDIYNKSGKLKPYKTITKELLKLRLKKSEGSNHMNVNNIVSTGKPDNNAKAGAKAGAKARGKANGSQPSTKKPAAASADKQEDHVFNLFGVSGNLVGS